MLVYIIVGSIREGRTAIKVANWAFNDLSKQQLPDIQVELVDLKEWALPIFAGSHPPATGIYDQPKQQAWADKIALADAFILITPEYNHGYTPALKNALDYLGEEWRAKPVAFISYGGTYGSRSISQIRQVTSSFGMIDPDATIEIRDISKRNKSELFEPNEFETEGLSDMIQKLKRYHIE